MSEWNPRVVASRLDQTRVVQTEIDGDFLFLLFENGCRVLCIALVDEEDRLRVNEDHLAAMQPEPETKIVGKVRK